jgi:hypothetical protein
MARYLKCYRLCVDDAYLHQVSYNVLLELRLNKDYAWPGGCVISRVAAVQRIVPGVWARAVSDAE